MDWWATVPGVAGSDTTECLTTSSVPTGERSQNGLQAELSLGPFLEGTVEHFRSVRTGNALAKKGGPYSRRVIVLWQMPTTRAPTQGVHSDSCLSSQ